MKLGSKSGWRSIVPLPQRSKLANSFCVFPRVDSVDYTPGRTPVYLNVYDLTPINGCVKWAGLGVFHTGVEVHGVEYAFGAHDFSMSGIFEIEPRQCPGFKFRESIFIGTTCLDPFQLREFMGRQCVNYHGDSYNLITKNCNHFCEDICYKLTGKPIPKWINRLARIGSLCSCVMPQALRSSTVPDSEGCEIERTRLRSSLNCLSSVSMPRTEVSISSLFLHSHYKSCFPPWQLKRPKHGPLKKRNR